VVISYLPVINGYKKTHKINFTLLVLGYVSVSFLMSNVHFLNLLSEYVIVLLFTSSKICKKNYIINKPEVMTKSKKTSLKNSFIFTP
jgi:hypothetical protein